MNKQYPYDVLVFNGRFQPFHNAHFKTIEDALKVSRYVLISIGSANQPRTIKNPWTAEERMKMIFGCFSEEDLPRIMVHSLQDNLYNEQQWIISMQRAVERMVSSVALTKPKIGITGHYKDDSSYYLRLFPQWEYVPSQRMPDIDSTFIRDHLFGHQGIPIPGNFPLPYFVYQFLTNFCQQQKEAFQTLVKEWEYIKQYREQWSSVPFPPTFVVVDAVVIMSGHILLVRRRIEPGKNLWAFPGGFVNNKERLLNAMLRELKEETRIGLSVSVLEKSVVDVRTFDHPERSLRGRTITHAHLLRPPDGQLPRVKGGDDAKDVKWTALSAFEDMASQMFEDHHSIGSYFIGTL